MTAPKRKPKRATLKEAMWPFELCDSRKGLPCSECDRIRRAYNAGRRHGREEAKGKR